MKKSRFFGRMPTAMNHRKQIPPQLQTRKVHFHIFSFSVSNIFEVFAMKTMNKLTVSNKARCPIDPQYCWTSSTSHLVVMGCTGKLESIP